jgi:hypothetical protein
MYQIIGQLTSGVQIKDPDAISLNAIIHPRCAPDIFNTDQGSQFTSLEFTQLLKQHGIAISMDGKAAGATTCSLSVCGNRSSTRKCICALTIQ